jgi:serine protease Do
MTVLNVRTFGFPEIRRDGQPRRAWLGAAVQQIDPALGAALGLDPASGLLVNDVRAGSPAAAAGLRPGDVILAFDGQALAKVRDLNKRLLYARPGASAVLTVLRDGRTSMLQFILSERAEPADIQAGPAADGADKTTAPSKTASSPDAHPSAAAPFGIVVEEASASRGERRTEADRGGTIGAVSPDSPAAALGLRSGDRILAVGSTSVADGLHLHELLQRAKGHTVALLVQRSGDRQQYLVLSDRRDASGARAPDQSVSAIGGPF